MSIAPVRWERTMGGAVPEARRSGMLSSSYLESDADTGAET